MLLPNHGSSTNACKCGRWCNPGPSIALSAGPEAGSQPRHTQCQRMPAAAPNISVSRCSFKGFDLKQLHQKLRSPSGTSSSWPGSILNEAFHFLAAPAPQCASNWVHEKSRSASGLRRQSAHSQITRWGPSSKVPRMLLQVTTNCRAQGVSGMGHAPAGHQEMQGTVLPGAGMLSKGHTNHRPTRGIAQSAQPSLSSMMPCQSKPPMECRLYIALRGMLVMLHVWSKLCHINELRPDSRLTLWVTGAEA